MKTTLAAAVAGVLAITGAARAAESSEPEFSLSLGGGLAYELLGINAAVRAGHVESYVGLGLMSLLPGVAAGVRWFAQQDGSGFFIGLNGGAHLDTIRIDEEDSTGGRLFWATVTPGYRVAGKRVFAQIAAGGGIVASTTFWSTPPSPTRNWSFFPDAALGIGVRL